jgi:starvation-inducible DNA-binding protein
MSRTSSTAAPSRTTHNTLSADIRQEMVALLNKVLGEAIDLGRHAKQAHWNVRGPAFIAVHKLFDEVYEDVIEYGDLVAERAVQLGGVVDGRVGTVAEVSSLTVYPLDAESQDQHVTALTKSLATFGKTVREAIAKADDAGDADSADICTEISRGIDKWLWMVEAHLSAR